jgi:cytochrome c oxidase assembly protein subunit 15
MTTAPQATYDRQIAAWLILCAGVIFGMILLGGVTRLTNSGLSMVEWKPLMGIVPPLGEQAWLETFEKYKQYPEYQKINMDMDLAGFKYIFMYEYLHRVLGRLIGVLYLLPLLYFLFKRRVRPGLAPKLWVLFFMGGLQGLLGWYMVKSGLVDRPDVSQYRLTAHLGLAVAIYAYMLWVAFDLLFPPGNTYRAAAAPFAGWSLGLVLLVYLMILSGGLVAGTDAGISYPTWPLMGPSFIPEGLYATVPAWLAAFEDVTTIQFNHRMFAYTLFVLVNLFALQVLRSEAAGRSRTAAVLLMLALLIQVVLGISTLLSHVAVPVAAAHQGGAVLLLSAMVFLSHVLVRQ